MLKEKKQILLKFCLDREIEKLQCDDLTQASVDHLFETLLVSKIKDSFCDLQEIFKELDEMKKKNDEDFDREDYVEMVNYLAERLSSDSYLINFNHPDIEKTLQRVIHEFTGNHMRDEYFSEDMDVDMLNTMTLLFVEELELNPWRRSMLLPLIQIMVPKTNKCLFRKRIVGLKGWEYEEWMFERMRIIKKLNSLQITEKYDISECTAGYLESDDEEDDSSYEHF
jgi:hypothetical protein